MALGATGAMGGARACKLEISHHVALGEAAVRERLREQDAAQLRRASAQVHALEPDGLHEVRNLAQPNKTPRRSLA